jgi:hypothetical protein
LSSLEVPALARVEVSFGINAPLTSVRVGSLAHVGETLGFNGTHLPETGLDALSSGVTRGLNIIRNDNLSDLPDLSFVTSLEWLNVEDNPVLPTCEVEAFLAGLDPQPDQVNVRGNDDAAVCE